MKFAMCPFSAAGAVCPAVARAGSRFVEEIQGRLTGAEVHGTTEDQIRSRSDENSSIVLSYMNVLRRRCRKISGVGTVSSAQERGEAEAILQPT